jgi:hypothetical protein
MDHRRYEFGRKVNREIILERMADAVSVFCTDRPPVELMKHEELDNYDEAANWILSHLKPEFQYATAYAIYNTAEDVAKSQIENGAEEYICTPGKKKKN